MTRQESDMKAREQMKSDKETFAVVVNRMGRSVVVPVAKAKLMVRQGETDQFSILGEVTKKEGLETGEKINDKVAKAKTK